MKKHLCVFLSILLLAGMCIFPVYAETEGATYYVDPVNGDDENDGRTEDSALATLSAASALDLNPGDSVLLKAGGIFTGVFNPHSSGTADAPVTLSAYGDTEAEGLPLLTDTTADDRILLANVGGWVIENLEITSPAGGGIVIFASTGVFSSFVIRNCRIHDVSNLRSDDIGKVYSPIFLDSFGLFEGNRTRLEDVTIKDVQIYDSAYGIQMAGANCENSADQFESVEESYNRNFVFENLSLSDIGYDGVIFSAVNGAVLRNSSLVNCCIYSDSYTAPVWMHHSDNVLVEKCEVAGTQNKLDGMTVDFDGWTTNSTYQYIYSHDNTRFIKNCAFDNITKNAGNTVRYCLSVNDNKKLNMMVFTCISGNYHYTAQSLPRGMYDFSFYNNTLVNCSQFAFFGLKESFIANNIFYGKNAGISGINNKKTGHNWLKSSIGDVTNNCFYGILPFVTNRNSYFCDPGFVSDDASDPDSFRLAQNSLLLGKGIETDDDLTLDFYGNTLTAERNIGCYGGSGENVQAPDRPFLALSDR